MHMDEQLLLLFEGAMGFHCNRKKKRKMPFRCFKKIIELSLNSFLVTDDQFLRRGTQAHHIDTLGQCSGVQHHSG